MKKNSLLKFDMGNVTVKILLQGLWHWENNIDSTMHNHSSYEFHILMHGRAILETEKNSILLTEKDTVLIPPEVFHSFIIEEKGSVLISFSFYADKNRKKHTTDYYQVLQDKLTTVDDIAIIHKNPRIEEYITKIISNLYSEGLVWEDYEKGLFMLLFSEIFSFLWNNEHLQNENPDTQQYENDTRISLIEEYFNEYYMEDISLKKLSEIMYLSEKQTDRIIRKAFGEGFAEHLSKIRLSVAKKLLLNTDKEIKAIADAVGYKSYNGFYLAFKSKIGESPINYRKQKGEENEQTRKSY